MEHFVRLPNDPKGPSLKLRLVERELSRMKDASHSLADALWCHPDFKVSSKMALTWKNLVSISRGLSVVITEKQYNEESPGLWRDLLRREIKSYESFI